MNFIMAFIDYPFHGHHISHDLVCVRGGHSVIVKMAEAAKKAIGFVCERSSEVVTNRVSHMFAYT